MASLLKRIFSRLPHRWSPTEPDDDLFDGLAAFEREIEGDLHWQRSMWRWRWRAALCGWRHSVSDCSAEWHR